MKAGLKTVKNAVTEGKEPGLRFIVAIIGAPGSGKSTFSDKLRRALNKDGPAIAAVLPMDGFHLDNKILQARGLLDKKGAPETFDADGFASTLSRIRAGDKDVLVPVFDRSIDLARAGARLVSTADEIVIVEGNYLLLDRPEWALSVGHYDLTVFLDVPKAELEKRLVKRWITYGLDQHAAGLRARGNDMANAEIVMQQSVPADIRIVAP